MKVAVLEKIPLVLIGRAILALVAAMLFAAPWIFDPASLQILTELLCLLVLAVMWNLLAGYADIVTIGQHGFVGIGAYAFYAFAVLAGIDPYLAIPLAGLTTLLFALPAMVIIFRLRAAYLSVGTWVVAEVMMLGAGKLSALRRRPRRQPAGCGGSPVRHADRRTLHDHLRDVAASGRGGHGGDLRPDALGHRTRPDRHARQ